MRYSWRTASLAALAIGLSGLVTLACSDDDDDDNDNTPTTTADSGTDGTTTADAEPTGSGTVNVTANYQGTQQGPIMSALHTTFPPSGPPVAIGSNETPTLPGTNTYQIRNAPPGTWYLVAFISVGTKHTAPLPTDPVGAPQQVTVTAGGTVEATVNIADRIQDAGADADAGEDR